MIAYIMQTMPGSDTIIVSDDKDMRTIPGRLYRPMSDEMMEITSAEADHHFFTQCLTGDPTDGFPVSQALVLRKLRRCLSPIALAGLLLRLPTSMPV